MHYESQTIIMYLVQREEFPIAEGSLGNFLALGFDENFQLFENIFMVDSKFATIRVRFVTYSVK